MPSTWPSPETAELARLLAAALPEVTDTIDECLDKAVRLMPAESITPWLEGALRLTRSRRAELVGAYLDDLPDAVAAAGPDILAPAADMALYLSEIPDLADVVPLFLSSLPAIAARVEQTPGMLALFAQIKRMTYYVRDGIAPLLRHAPDLLEIVSIGGLANWIEFGITSYRQQPYHVALYFNLETADALAALQKERHGTLLSSVERQLRLTLHAFWGLDDAIRPYTQWGDRTRREFPHLDQRGFHLPDVLDDCGQVPALDLYRATLAHLAAHRLWSRPYTADNFSQLQHLAIECFEDARIETLAARRHPGLRNLWQSLHPDPTGILVPPGWNPVRHRLARLSFALLHPENCAPDDTVAEFVRRFHAEMDSDPHDPDLSARLGVALLPRIRTPDFALPRIWFDGTIVPYRDDNRFLWRFLEDTDSKDDFHSDHGTEPPPEEDGLILPRHWPEWDYRLGTYKTDWTTVYQAPAPKGDPAAVDRMLERNQATAKRIKRLIDRLKPQNRRRIRRQADGDDFDIDQAVTAVIDRRAGLTPDPRIHQRHVPDSRNIAVLLLLDLSQSINDKMSGSGRTLLDLSQESTALLAWAVEQLGDSFAIAGFASKTRLQVRFATIKDFAEPWDDTAKGRLAGAQAGLATRMGAALRHAGHLLDQRREEKKLVLLVSDGEPADIDEDDEAAMKWDTHMAVGELKARGVHTFCITLDRKADSYIADIFGQGGFAVIDRIERLPEKLTQAFLSLTR